MAAMVVCVEKQKYVYCCSVYHSFLILDTGAPATAKPPGLQVYLSLE